jgi:flagellar assembly factor FliW
VKTAMMEPPAQIGTYGKDTILHFDEGIIGFAACKEFVVIETEDIQPFRFLQDARSNEVSFLVMDPRIRVPDFYDQIPTREWESIGVTNPGHRLALVIVNIGMNPRESSANFQAPILVNYETMRCRQVILTDSGFCLRYPLLG